MESSQSNRDESNKKRVSPEAAAVQRKKETLLLARTHLQQQLQTNPHPRHRSMLENALADLERQLADLGGLGRAAGDAE